MCFHAKELFSCIFLNDDERNPHIHLNGIELAGAHNIWSALAYMCTRVAQEECKIRYISCLVTSRRGATTFSKEEIYVYNHFIL